MIHRYGRSYNHIHLELTTNCNLACPQCGRTEGDRPNTYLTHNELTLADIQRLIPPEDVKNLDRIYACGNYGDPVIAKDILPIFQYFREHNPDMDLGINTNGSLRNEAWWASLPGLLGPRIYVVFPLDGLEDTHHIYRRNSNWNKLIANIKAYIGAGGYASCDTLIFKHNEHQKEAIEVLVKELGFKQHAIKETNRHVDPSVSWLKLVEPRVIKAVKPTTTIAEPELLKKTIVKCDALKDGGSVFLGADGIFYPCCFIGCLPHSGDAPNYKHLTQEYAHSLAINPVDKKCVSVCGIQIEGKTDTELMEKERRLL